MIEECSLTMLAAASGKKIIISFCKSNSKDGVPEMDTQGYALILY